MVSFATIICVVITMLLSILFPVAILVILEVKMPKTGMTTAWLLGAAGFFVTQILIRIPILTVLQSQSWFLDFSANKPFLYVFGLAFTAGLFELAGRFAVARLLQKNLTSRRALAAGLGHGGIEAIVIVGIAYINNLIYIFMINSGTFDTLFAQLADSGIQSAQLELAMTQLETIRSQLVSMNPGMFLLGGLERVLAMTCHTAMSMLVCWGVASKKPLPAVLSCLAIHTFLDLTAGIQILIGTVLSQTAAYVLIYAILTAVAAASCFIVVKLLDCWPKMEVPHDSEK